MVSRAATSVIGPEAAAEPRLAVGIDAQSSAAVVATDDLVSDRIARALTAGGVTVCDRAADVERLTNGAAEATIVLASSASAGHQRDLVRAAARRFPKAPLILIGPPSLTAVRRVLEAGSRGYVAVSQIEPALVPTIRAVHAGQVCVPSEVRRHAIRPALSHREKQTLALLVSGLTNKQIGYRLCLAESTVKTHVTAVFNKLGVGSRSEAAALVLDSPEQLSRDLLEAVPPGPDR